MRYSALSLVSFVFLLACPADAEPDQDEAVAKEAPNFLAAVLERVTLGDPMQSGPLVLVPLVIDAAPDSPDVAPGQLASRISFGEAEWPESRFNVEVTNRTDRPVLVLGGTILAGGRLDRMLQRDFIMPPQDMREIPTLPAEYQQRYRREPVPFRPHTTLAPIYLRERAFSNPYRNLVPDFVSHFLEFRPADDDRLSLAAIDEAPALAKYCVSCQTGFKTFPDIAGHRVVGFITAVRGQIQSAEVFGHNALLQAYFDPLVRAHTYAAAAIELRAERLGLPLPKTEADDLVTAREKAAELLKKLKTRLRYRTGVLPEATLGQSLLLKMGGATGYAIGYRDRLVHAVVFLFDPFERRLYARPLNPPDAPETDEDVDVGELERGEKEGRRLTEYERRLLERIRQRRGAGG